MVLKLTRFLFFSIPLAYVEFSEMSLGEGRTVVVT